MAHATNHTKDRAWIKERLASNGYTQRDLARAWGISEASVTRFLQGTENADPPLSRATALAQMLGLSLDDLSKGLGYRGQIVLPPPSTTVSEGPRLGTVALQPHAGQLRLLLHLDLPATVAAEMVALLEKATPTGAAAQ